MVINPCVTFCTRTMRLSVHSVSWFVSKSLHDWNSSVGEEAKTAWPVGLLPLRRLLQSKGRQTLQTRRNATQRQVGAFRSISGQTSDAWKGLNRMMSRTRK